MLMDVRLPDSGRERAVYDTVALYILVVTLLCILAATISNKDHRNKARISEIQDIANDINFRLDQAYERIMRIEKELEKNGKAEPTERLQ